MLITKQLAADLEALQSGHCWIGYNALEILEGISFEMALTRGYEHGNSIWQIVNHISFWREIVAKRLIERKGITADKTGMDEPQIISADAWEQTKQRFNDSFEILLNATLQLKEEELYTELGTKGNSYFNITGCMQHDAFHLGQVILIKQSILNK